MDEQAKLYVEQMKLWFEEHKALGEQIERAVDLHKRLAELNKGQLAAHNLRMALAIEEYNAWAEENGVSEYASLPLG
ncbi:hypothetical protein ACFYU8_29650 [Brevibacillus sp. NPDC003359]|uniref:hypothetical protein n=1 Tax=unclassified Brevibacillus TaxID=2684853 RepID=UPI0036B137A6